MLQRVSDKKNNEGSELFSYHAKARKTSGDVGHSRSRSYLGLLFRGAVSEIFRKFEDV